MASLVMLIGFKFRARSNPFNSKAKISPSLANKSAHPDEPGQAHSLGIKTSILHPFTSGFQLENLLIENLQLEIFSKRQLSSQGGFQKSLELT